MIFSAKQVYAPTSSDCAFMIVSKLKTTVPFDELDITYLLALCMSIVAPLKYQLILGTGSPIT